MLMGLLVIMTDFIACRMLEYCKFGNLRESFIFMKLRMRRIRSLMKIIPSLNDEITVTFTDSGKSCPHCELLT